jgi:hypothetical protein
MALFDFSRKNGSIGVAFNKSFSTLHTFAAISAVPDVLLLLLSLVLLKILLLLVSVTI